MNKLFICHTRLLYSLFLTLSCFIKVSGQCQLSIKLQETESQTAIPFGTVMLAPVGDAGKRLSGITGKEGIIRLNCQPGRWQLRVSCINYLEFDTIFTIANEAPMTISIYLSRMAKAQDTAIVTAGKRELAFTTGGYEYNVDRQRAGLSINLSALLKLLPGVTLDNSGLPKVMGQPFLLWVDGERILLRGADLANFLKTFSAGDIRTIKVYTTPPAIYDAAGNTVIEIITARNIKKGLEGRLEGNVRTHDKYYSGLYLGYANKSYSGNFRASYDHSNTRYSEGLDQVNLSSPDSLYFYHNRTSIASYVTNSLNLSTVHDFALDPHHTIGITARLNYYDHPLSTVDGMLSIYNMLDQLTQNQLFNRENEARNLFGFVGVNYRGLLNKKGDRILLDASVYQRKSHVWFDQYTQTLNDQDHIVSFSDVEKNNTHNDATVGITSFTYTKALGSMQLRAGGKLTLADNQENLLDSASLNRIDYFLDSSATYRLKYTENVGALFASLGGALGKVKYVAGLRWEQTRTSVETIPSENYPETVRSYSQFFPSLSLSYSPDPTSTIGLGVKRSIIRPAYDQLNPLPVRTNSVLTMIGNPGLQPILQYAFDLNASKEIAPHNDLSLMTKYSISLNPYIPVILPSTVAGEYVQQSLNYRSNTSLYINIGYETRISERLKLSLSLYGFDTWIDLDNLQGLANPRATPTGGGILSGTWSCWKDAAVEIDNSYQSAQVFAQGRGGGFYYTDISFTKPLGSSWSFSLKVSDIFNTDKEYTYSGSASFSSTSFEKNETQIGTLSLLYKFGHKRGNKITNYQNQDDQRFTK